MAGILPADQDSGLIAPASLPRFLICTAGVRQRTAGSLGKGRGPDTGACKARLLDGSGTGTRAASARTRVIVRGAKAHLAADLGTRSGRVGNAF